MGFKIPEGTTSRCVVIGEAEAKETGWAWTPKLSLVMAELECEEHGAGDISGRAPEPVNLRYVPA